MKRYTLLFLLMVMQVLPSKAQYNDLWIPDTLSGTNFYLSLIDTFKQIMPSGNQTITSGINGNFWGPTLFFNQGETVHMHVTNNSNDSATIHWHGLHLPAVMDGGPHQVIPPGALWEPFFEVKNNAATYWYHPHMHEMTTAQMTAGLGGFIIVRDPAESALNLPRTYGVDDFPLSITDRRFNSSNQFVVSNYTDSLMVNGILSPQLNVPANVVRFRILNTSPQRTYNLGFSDNRQFSVIGSDGGLLSAPVSLTRFLLCPGERVEILVDLTNQEGQVLNLMAYNASLSSDITGATVPPGPQPTDALNGQNFRILHLTISASLVGGITAIPTSLINNELIDITAVNTTRTINFVDGFLNGFPNSSFDGVQFNLSTINKTIAVNSTELWELKNNSTLAHSFHIHDVQFNVISRTGSTSTLQAYDMGWKDNVLVRAGETLKFVAKFEDYADALHPFMYHCHMTVHEDEGMMGQFVVVDNSTGISNSEKSETPFSIFPNPSQDKLFVKMEDIDAQIYYIRIIDESGRTILMLPRPSIENGIDVSQFAKGRYHLILTDELNKRSGSKAFMIH